MRPSGEGGREETQRKIFKALRRYYGAVSPGCSSDVLCGLGHVTQRLCATVPISRRITIPTQAR